VRSGSAVGGNTISHVSAGSPTSCPCPIDNLFHLCYNVVMRCREPPAIIFSPTRLALLASIVVDHCCYERRIKDV
jgi:hypothetical protein